MGGGDATFNTKSRLVAMFTQPQLLGRSETYFGLGVTINNLEKIYRAHEKSNLNIEKRTEQSHFYKMLCCYKFLSLTLFSSVFI